ncbi:MAG: hypothetical protein F4040_07685 [Synechococcus sp. SB0670_bin_20]|nr:hypothetical protein [Synechococcus sp. SB0670_bin_20]
MGVRIWLLRCSWRLRHPARSTLVVVAVLLAGGLAVDLALGRMYRTLRPSLEEEYGRALGRPLTLGSYRGLRWSGLHVGPSRILPNGVDLTQLAADGLVVSVDPWASLHQRRWVVHLHVQGLEADWRRNAQGAVWTVPPAQGEGAMPVELWVHTRNPAQFRLWWQPGADGPPSPDLMGAFVGRMALGHRQHDLVIKGQLDLASGGRLSVASRGVPLSESWVIHGKAHGVQLDGLNPLLANTPAEVLAGLSGQVDGAVTVRTSQDSPCRGAVVFNDLQLPLQRIDPTGELGEVRFGPLSLGCDGRHLQLSPSGFHVGALTGQVQGSLGLVPDQPLDLRATVDGPLPPPLASLGGNAAADLRLLGPLTAPESQVRLTITDWRTPAAAAADAQPLPPLTLQLASQWRSAEEQRQLWASLQAQAGASQVVMAGQLTPMLHLQSSAVTLQPRDWLPPDLWPDQPYTGSLTMAMDQAGATPEVRLRLRNPHLQEDFTLELAEDQLHVNGRLELAAGQHLGITGRADGGQWRLAANLSEMDVAPVLDGALPLPPLWPSPLSVTATAQGRYGDTPSPDSGQGGRLQVERARLTARLPHGLHTPDGPLLGSAELRLQTTAQGQWALQMEAPRLQGHGVVDWWPGRPWQEAGLDLSLALEKVSLAPLRPLHGELSLTGQLGGSLAQPRFDGELMLAGPGLALIRSPRRWRGEIASLASGHTLHLAAGSENTSPGKADPALDVRVTSAWQLQDLEFRAGDGHLDVAVTEEGYRWLAQDLPLSWLQADAVELAGTLQGQGELSLPPGPIHGDITVNGPRWGSLRSRKLDLSLTGKDHQLLLDGQLLTDPTTDSTGGQLAWAVRINQQPGTPQPWSIRGDFDAVPLQTLRQGVALTREVLQRVRAQVGSSRDLGTLVIGAAGESLATQLEHLAMAHERLRSLEALLEQTHNRQLQNLDGQLHGDVQIRGAADQPVWAAVRTDLQLWLVEAGVNHPLAPGHGPFHLHMEGPLQGAGAGTLRFSGLPLKLINVLANLRLPWQGSLAGRGQHQDLLGERLVSLTLALQGGQFHGHAIQSTSASLRLKGAALAVEMALQTAASSLLTVNGDVNLDGGDEAFQLRLSAGNEVMAFLPSLSDGAVAWTRGDARTTLLVRGPLEQPVFHGFLRLREAEGRVAGVPIRNLNSVVLFDLNNLFVEQLEATVGEAGGGISGSGFLGILQPLTTDDPLTMKLEDVDINTPNGRFRASGDLVLHGSVQDPELGGDLRLDNGVIRADGNGEANAVTTSPAAGPAASPEAETPDNPVNDRLRAWDWQEPLELVDLEGISRLERSLLQVMAELPPIDLRSLNLKLGPDLRLEAATVANFSIATPAGLNLTGTMGPDLQARGLVKLLRGQVNLFTSRFRLDPHAPNVVIFSADSGLTPYLDVAMWTQEADTSQGPGQDAAEITGSTTAFDNLNLVRIQAVVEGPADEFPAILRLQSKPPRSQEELVALIGGNSMNRLVQGSTNSRLFSIVGQPLVDTVLNQVGHALGQRVTFSITPASFTPAPAGDSQQATEEFVLAGELELNLMDRVDMAVLGALNRSDLPPQVKLSFQLTPAMAAEITAERGGYAKGILQFSSRF